MNFVIVFILNVFICGLSMNVFSAENSKENNIVYEYKKYEKFDFEDLSIDAELVTPGDVSIYDNVSRKFINNLPYRKNFNKEIRKAVERIN